MSRQTWSYESRRREGNEAWNDGKGLAAAWVLIDKVAGRRSVERGANASF